MTYNKFTESLETMLICKIEQQARGIMETTDYKATIYWGFQVEM
jgi:hypothetical protein